MTVFATVGYPGSGKGEVATVAHEVGVPVVRMGDTIRRECRRRCLPVTEDTLGYIASSLREREGIDAIARRSFPLIEATHQGYESVLIDGIRGHAELAYFREQFTDRLSVIAIEAPFDLRLARVRERNRDPTANARTDLEARDERERGYGMDEAIANADHTIENTSTLSAFHDDIRSILEADIVA